MKYTLIILFVISIGCERGYKNNSGEKETPSKVTGDNPSEELTNWYDALLVNYIHNSKNELIQNTLRQNISEQWLLDRTEMRDNAKYLVFHIRHDVTDSGNVDPRFVTDGWIYLDSLTKTIYEYDLPNDRLVKWEKEVMVVT